MPRLISVPHSRGSGAKNRAQNSVTNFDFFIAGETSLNLGDNNKDDVGLVGNQDSDGLIRLALGAEREKEEDKRTRMRK